MKRLFDFCAASFALILLSPLLLAIAVLIKIDSPGPVLYRQNRVGRNGELFSICKFRSMCVSQGPDAPYNTQPGDTRITRIGKLIRSTSLDELPQLINVFKGEMSLVGPRPDLEIQERDYAPEDWRLRISVTPGITGLAQINGRSDLSFEDRLHYDLEYVRRQSFALDLRVILQTIGAVIRGRHTN